MIEQAEVFFLAHLESNRLNLRHILMETRPTYADDNVGHA